MSTLRIAYPDSVAASAPCCRCHATDRSWDQIAAQPYCPNCQELLAVGEADPLILATEKNGCAVCEKLGTVCFHTFPRHGRTAVEIDLCPEHLRGLLARQLNPHAFMQLQRQLSLLEIGVEEIFLLHGAFYDSRGRALQPAIA